MKKELGCFSPSGLLAAFLVIVTVTGYTFLNGGELFSPGPLTAATTGSSPREGIRSHAEIQGRCTRCHRPWSGIDPQRCTACHTNVRDQVTAGDGLHGRLENPDACTHCHTEHQGPNANITAAALTSFPHHQFGFSLIHHQSRRDGQPFVCVDCHADTNYRPSQALCRECHAALDAAQMTQHVIDFSEDCLACHDGSGNLAEFDHSTVFALDGAHAALSCTQCHINGIYAGLASECLTCHQEPDVHRDQFGTECGACHTTSAWTPARLLQHTFPLDHGSRSDVDCPVCHSLNYVTYSCYNCHEHNKPEIEQKHVEEKIHDFENCVECHPVG